MSDEDEAASGAISVSRRDDIIARLYTALDQKMREIETRIERTSHDNGEGMSAADCERDARTLTTLAKLYEKISELESAPDPSLDHEGVNQEKQESDAARFRNDIAQRLTRMLEAEED